MSTESIPGSNDKDVPSEELCVETLQKDKDIEHIIHETKYKRYNRSTKGKVRIQKAKAARNKALNKYASTDKGKDAKQKASHKYSKTEKGKISTKETKHKYSKTEKGKIAGKIILPQIQELKLLKRL
ncbi:unnamed protein product [Meganyctiphanes norvegica]|uniref:Uncharacterized protein n=1 Tax=Meganyctiphanes norvegica TaxID=48144 RepID=A0AAV2QZ59_MEGNR